MIDIIDTATANAVDVERFRQMYESAIPSCLRDIATDMPAAQGDICRHSAELIERLKLEIAGLELQVKMRPLPEIREDTGLIEYNKQLRAEVEALTKDNDFKVALIQEQARKIGALRRAIELLDRCLKDLHPYGAKGVIFDRWNQARTIMIGETAENETTNS